MAKNGSKRVTLSTGTIDKLKPISKPFESLEECIERLANCDCIQNEMETQNDDVDDE